MSTVKSESSVSSTGSLYQRPSFGIEGKEIKVKTNFYSFKEFKGRSAYHYDVEILPEKNKGVNWKVFKQITQIYENDIFDGHKVVFDGNKTLLSPYELKFGDSIIFEVTLPEPPGRQPSDKNIFSVRFRKVNTISLDILDSSSRNLNLSTKDHLPALMAIDIILKHKLSMNNDIIGGSFYFPDDAFKLFGGLEAWQGIFQTAKLGQDKIFINIDNAVCTFFSGIGLDDMASKVLGYSKKDELLKEFDNIKYDKLSKAFKGLKIEVNYRGDRAKKYRVEGLTEKCASETFFKIGESENTTDVERYFNDTYKIRLQYKKLPCIVAKNGVKIPIELCIISPGQRFKKKLNERQTSEMIKLTCQHPNSRMKRICDSFERLNFKENDYTKAFGIQINPEMEVIGARVLKAPRISYLPGSVGGLFAPEGGSWNLRDKKLFIGSSLNSWGVIFFGNPSQASLLSIQKFVLDLVGTCEITGMKFGNRKPPIVYIDPMKNIESDMRSSWREAGNIFKKRPQLMLCILTNTSSQIYGEIKRVGETVIGVPTQCIQSKNIFNPKKQYCANVCLKMNAKLGGVNFCLIPEEIPFIYEKRCIIFGADISHSLNRHSNSIASIVSTLNPRAATYSSSYIYLKPKQEVIMGLSEMVKKGLLAYYQDCKFKPESVIFYRDGVSDGQLSEVLQKEVLSIKLAFSELGENYSPALTFISIQKRHHVKLFPLEKSNADRSGNCLPGTVVDNYITSPRQFDFYLNSHAGIQGTSKSTRYIILYDENKFSPDEIQNISFKLCYTFLRCTRAVSVVPPIFYAHLLAARTMHYSKGFMGSDVDTESCHSESIDLGSKLKEELKDIMYYV